MNRYQIYLDPQSVAVFDEVDKLIDISRSQIIRQVVDRVAQALLDIIAVRKKSAVLHYSALDKLVGCLKLKTKKKTNFALDDDSFYFND